MFRVFLEACAQSRPRQGTSCIAAISRCTYRPLYREYLPPMLYHCCIAVLRCPETGRQRSHHHSGIPAGYFLRACSSSLIEISQRATIIFARRGQSLGRDSGAGTAKKVLADLSCDRCLMQLARVASHQTPGAVDEPIGDGVEVAGLLLQVPHPLPCHE